MAEAASRLACWVCWLRHDGLLGSALGKQEAEQGREKERRERERAGFDRNFSQNFVWRIEKLSI